MKPIKTGWLAALLASWLWSGMAVAEEPSVASAAMSQQLLNDLIKHHCNDVKFTGNIAEFNFNDITMLLVSDVSADRMRIISPIAHVSDVEPQMVIQAMAANFHSVLDARYALGDDGTIYAAFLHPLSPLTEQQLLSALHQVASAQETFGSTFTGGDMVFPGREDQPPPANVI